MRILLDTNVVLDLLLDREPWVKSAVELFSKIEAGAAEGYLGATTVTTIHYLATKSIGSKRALEEVRKLLALCSIAPVNRPVLENALELDLADFEDGVLCAAARQVAVEAVVTRNPRDFKKADLSILSPDECVELIKQSERSADRRQAPTPEQPA